MSDLAHERLQVLDFEQSICKPERRFHEIGTLEHGYVGIIFGCTVQRIRSFWRFEGRERAGLRFWEGQGLQVGLRRAEIAAFRVGDLHVNRGFDSLRVVRKGAKKDALAINPQTAQRIRAYLDASTHADDFDGPLFRPLRHNGRQRLPRRHLNPDAIDRVVKNYARRLGLTRGYSAHSMRATFITTALENGCSLEDVQRAAAHADPSTTKLYDRRGYNPEKSASFFANY